MDMARADHWIALSPREERKEEHTGALVQLLCQSGSDRMAPGRAADVPAAVAILGRRASHPSAFGSRATDQRYPHTFPWPSHELLDLRFRPAAGLVASDVEGYGVPSSYASHPAFLRSLPLPHTPLLLRPLRLRYYFPRSPRKGSCNSYYAEERFFPSVSCKLDPFAFVWSLLPLDWQDPHSAASPLLPIVQLVSVWPAS
mmetsp:Transcript_14697/g.55617  ORF Transcript_14697/g.55617 Transcript_14697/m.55617 type:complete len:200 (+) Transcript_14697:133-732(+)